MKVEVVTPEDYVGNVIGDLNGRRGQIQGQESARRRRRHQRDGAAGQHVQVRRQPALDVARAARQYTMQFDHYEPVPTAVAQEVQKKYA